MKQNKTGAVLGKPTTTRLMLGILESSMGGHESVLFRKRTWQGVDLDGGRGGGAGAGKVQCAKRELLVVRG